jgi:hypothetical protein
MKKSAKIKKNDKSKFQKKIFFIFHIFINHYLIIYNKNIFN